MRIVLAFAVIGTAACGHNDLFQPEEPAKLPPRGSGVFHRVTFNPGDDRFPSWLPGDTAIVYATEASDDPGTDRCIATVAAEGGTRHAFACFRRLSGDSAANSDWPAAAQGGRIAYVWEPVRAYPENGTPDSVIVFVDELAAPGAPRSVFTFPYIDPGVRFYTYRVAPAVAECGHARRRRDHEHRHARLSGMSLSSRPYRTGRHSPGPQDVARHALSSRRDGHSDGRRAWGFR